MKESELLTYCLRLLSAFSIFAWRNNNMGVRRERNGKAFYTFNGTRGVADIIAVHPKNGKIICIECKAEGKLKNKSPEQKDFQEQIEKSGGYYFLIDSYDMLIKKLEENKIYEVKV